MSTEPIQDPIVQEDGPHRMDQKRLKATRIKQAAGIFVYLVWSILSLVQYYSPDAAKRLNESGGSLIIAGVLGPLMFVALRSSKNDWAELRGALPEGMRGQFDAMVDIASTVQGTGQGLTPREMDIGGVRATVLVPRHVALQIAHPAGTAE